MKTNKESNLKAIAHSTLYIYYLFGRKTFTEIELKENGITSFVYTKFVNILLKTRSMFCVISTKVHVEYEDKSIYYGIIPSTTRKYFTAAKWTNKCIPHDSFWKAFWWFIKVGWYQSYLYSWGWFHWHKTICRVNDDKYFDLLANFIQKRPWK